MNKTYLGIDLGTSGVKVLKIGATGILAKSRTSYEEPTPAGWYAGLQNALQALDLSDVAAIGLSSQVGTYIINSETVLPWSDGAGGEELKELRRQYSAETFVREIGMNHPEIISYPLPRLRYIKKHFQALTSVCQPKDWLCHRLTGVWKTDCYSMRGLANAKENRYSAFFLQELGISPTLLPELADARAPAGSLTSQAAAETGLPAGIPVYLGMNDFFCGLLGMGMTAPGCAFDITGTSEHLGLIQDVLQPETKLVSSPYLSGFVHYGVTASSGVSLDFGLKHFGTCPIDPDASIRRKAPVFLPYLKGERAPIFDADARGAFFGLENHCTGSDLAYSVLEGNAFSLYHIWEHFGNASPSHIVCGGGAAKNDILCKLKSSLLGVPLHTLTEPDTSALGAAMLAAVGEGAWQTLQDAADSLVQTGQVYHPDEALRKKLLPRYQIYQALYPQLKETYQKWKELTV